MNQTRESFAAIVGKIISDELNEIQQEQFNIEGMEMIGSLFSIHQFPVYDSEDDLVFDFGISPSDLDLRSSGVLFSEVISSCFFLLKPGVGLLPVSSWRTVLEKEKTDPALVDLLCGKYQDLLTESIPPS